MRLEWSEGTRELAEQPLLVGRDPLACDIAIESDGLLSRVHFALVPSKGGAFLLDLRSSNGTYVNGSRVHYARLQCGDQIRAGTGSFRVRGGVAVGPAWNILPPPQVSFLGGGGGDHYLEFLRGLPAASSWEDALGLATRALAAQADLDGVPDPVALALGLDGDDPVARAGSGGPTGLLAEVLGPSLTRFRALGRPFLVESLAEDTSYLPPGYPIHVRSTSLAAAPLGPRGRDGVLLLTTRVAGARLKARHLVLVETLAHGLTLASHRLLRERAKA